MVFDEEKDFEQWNIRKQKLDQKKFNRRFYYNEREVWWCSVGINIGVESDGKNNHFERPVLILKKFNGHMFWGIPLTSKEKDDEHHQKISHNNGFSWVMLSQIRIFSTKRMLRKIGMISENEFKEVIGKIMSYMTIGPRITAGSSEAGATNG